MGELIAVLVFLGAAVFVFRAVERAIEPEYDPYDGDYVPPPPKSDLSAPYPACEDTLPATRHASEATRRLAPEPLKRAS